MRSTVDALRLLGCGAFRIRELTSGDAPESIPRISPDWSQIAALSGIWLHTAARIRAASALVRGGFAWFGRRPRQDSNLRHTV